MDIEEAFRVFHLPVDASESDVRKAYLQLTRVTHPDAAQGDSERQKILNEAYECAIAYCKIRFSVIPVNSQILRRNLEHLLTLYTGQSAAEKARTVERRRTRRLQLGKWFSWAVGALMAVLALTEKVPGVLGLSEEAAKHFNSALGLYTLIFGALGCALQVAESWQRQKIESFVEEISEKKDCACKLAKLLEYEDIPSVTETDLRSHRRRMEYETPFRFILGHHDLNGVLVTKALEHALLIPEESEQLTPDSVQSFSVRFKPSLFKPAPPPPPKRNTEKELRFNVGCLVIGFFLCSALTIFIAVAKVSLWSLLPGVFALACAGGALENFLDLRRRKHGMNKVSSEHEAPN